jgi:hypothetical protein
LHQPLRPPLLSLWRRPCQRRNFDHRKRWLEDRLIFLAAQFGIDVVGFSILSNHFHLILG